MPFTAFTFSAYESFVTRRLFVEEMDHKGNRGVQDKISIPPGRRRKALRRCLTGVIYLSIFALYSSDFSYFKLLRPELASKGFFIR